jgi:putative hemolysin
MSAHRDDIFSLDWRPKGPVRRAAFSAARPVLERVLGITELARIYRERPEGVAGVDFMSWTLDLFGADVRVAPSDLDRIPKGGPVVVVANHPFGAIEGVALARAVKRVRADVKVLANLILGRIPEFRDVFLLVDPFGGDDAKRTNPAVLRRALAWLKGGGALVVFPAGEVASLDLRSGRVTDPTWSPTVAGLIRASGAAAVPVFIPGRNGALFQTAGLIHPALRTALLPRQLAFRRKGPIELRIGRPIPAARLAELGDDAKAIAYLRDRTEILAERVPATAWPGREAVQPRRTPARVETVVDPAPTSALAADVAGLPADALLVEADEMQVFVARAGAIPNVLREIGRLREVTFRDVGEGTGRSIDLDAFDASYLHLFIWDREAGAIVGAYRLGPTDEIMARSGVSGLYTSTLFRYDRRLFDAMGPALEMGRSWIRTEYQKSYAGLVLLWRGIGEFVARHPCYATLFGPVSISAEYRSISQKLIVAFLEKNRKLADWARFVKPTNPFRDRHRRGARPGPASLADLEAVSSFISEIEGDQKGVPILLKQYLKLDGWLLGYNVDPDFSNVLDVLILVDLRRTAPRVLDRYMGKGNAASFRAFHHDDTTRTRTG